MIIVTLFRKAKLKHHGILPTKQNHVAKQQYWRKVKIIENIELPYNEQKKVSENFNAKYDISKFETSNEDADAKNEKSLFVFFYIKITFVLKQFFFIKVLIDLDLFGII